MTKFVRFVFAITMAITLHQSAVSQSLSINTTGAVADPSAILDVTSTLKGMLIPRMDKTAKSLIGTPANGLLVYQTGPDSIGFHYYDLPNTQWVYINTNGFANDSTAWKLTGNNNVVDTSFLGSINNKPLKFRVNNLPSGIIDSTTGDAALGYRALATAHSSQGFYANNALGFEAGRSLNAGSANIAIGRHALASTGVSSQNIAIGDSAMGQAVSAHTNLAIGYQALKNYNGGGYLTYNTAIGYASQSAASSTVGGLNSFFNTSIGGFAMADNRGGIYNVAVGVSALRSSDSSGGNTAIGINAMYAHKRSGYNSNVAIGAFALAGDSTGFWNTVVGAEAMQNAKTGGVNTAIGFRSMRAHKVGGENTAVGVGTLEADSSGTQNTAVGRSALFLNKMATRNTVVGAEAGVYNNYLQTNPLQGSENTYVGFNSGRNANVGRKNAVLGAYALQGTFFYGDQPTLDAYSRNSVVGDSAALRTFGNDNVAMGFKALNSNTSGSQHVAIGSRALANTTATYPNTAVGYSSQDSATTGFANTALGSYSLTRNKQGYNNTAIGNAAMFEAVNTASPIAVFDNTAVGNDALRLTRRSGQVAVGAGALRSDTSGFFNTGVGYLSLQNNLSGILNTALGTSSMRNNTTGGGNTALGGNAMNDHKTGSYNTAVGYESMYSDTAGADNTSVGWRSFRYTLAGIANTAIGVGALEFTDSATGNTAVGRGAMIGTFGNTTALGYNTVLGYYAGAQMDSVSYSTAIGMQAGYNNRGTENTFIGLNAGAGFSASNLTGIENTGLGSHTLTFTNTGQANTAAGHAALNLNTTGSGNTSVGVRTLLNNVDGNNNVALGDSALLANTSGSNNTAIGYKADMVSGNLTNASAIGSNARVDQNNSMVLGSINGVNSATANTNVGIGTTTPDSTFSVADNFLVGSSGTVQYDNSVPVMNYMFKTGFNNADRMVIAHSPSFPNWGLQYQDAGDRFNFLSAGASVLTADLGSQRVGIGNNVPAKQLHVFAGTSGAVTNAASQILMEDNTTSYLEMSTPAAFENGILSSIPTTGIRSGIVFGSNNSLQLRSGGNTNRLYIDNGGYTGINRVPTTGPTVGTLQVQNISATDDVFGLYNSSTGNRWTYWVASSALTGPPAVGVNDLSIWYNGSLRGNFNNATGNYTILSDKRLKKDIVGFNYGLSVIQQLSPYKYHYLDNDSNIPLSVGFMAQDIEKIYPEAVHKVLNKEGKEIYTLDYQAFGVLAIKGIQEQQQIIDKQQKQIDDLIKRIEKLEQK